MDVRNPHEDRCCVCGIDTKRYRGIHDDSHGYWTTVKEFLCDGCNDWGWNLFSEAVTLLREQMR